MKENIKNKKGYTFVEIIIVLFVLGIILAITMFSFNALNDRQSLDKNVDLIKSLINQSRTNALNSKNGQDQNMVFSTTSVIYGDNVFDLSNNVELYSYTTATNTITFYRVSGMSSATGTLNYVLKRANDIIATSSITINNLGIIE